MQRSGFIKDDLKEYIKIQWQKIEATRQRLASQNPEKTEELPSKSENLTDGRTEASTSVESFSVAQAKKMPMLPEFQPRSIPSFRNDVSPYLAMNLLKEIEARVSGWQEELQEILQQIQDIYLEGPIIEGWLESDSQKKPGEGEGNRGRMFNNPFQNPEPTVGYRLVGRDRNGNLWVRPCPPAELPSVIVALARYQKLLHLLERKEQLETYLTQLAESLVVLQGHIQML